MRKMRICEERGRGIDEVVRAAEILQLPAPEFRATEQRTVVTVFGHKPFDSMDREDRIRACYQHCVLRRVMSEKMTNQSLPANKSKTAVISQVIAATLISSSQTKVLEHLGVWPATFRLGRVPFKR